MDKRLIAALVGLLSLPVAGSPHNGSDTPVELLDGWVRALPPTQTSTAAYMTLVNRGQQPLAVTGASASIAQRVEIHTTREVDGMVRMERLPQLQLAPGEQVQLVPGGTHIMLLGLERMPQAGETVRLCLELAPGGQRCIDAPVRKSAGDDGAHHHHH